MDFENESMDTENEPHWNHYPGTVLFEETDGGILRRQFVCGECGAIVWEEEPEEGEAERGL